MAGIILDSKQTGTGLSIEALSYVKEFKNRLSKDKLISRNDVLSLEEFIGSPIVTGVVSINKLTNIKSNIGYDSVESVLEDVIKDAPIQKVITISDLLEVYSRVMGKLASIKKLLLETSTTALPNDCLAVLAKPFKRRWIDEQLYDPMEDDILNIIRANTALFNQLDDIVVLPLLSLLKSPDAIKELYRTGSSNIDMVTIKDVVYMLTNRELIVAIDTLMASICTDRNAIYSLVDYDMSDKNYKRKYKLMPNILDTLNDAASIAIIEVIFYILKEAANNNSAIEQ